MNILNIVGSNCPKHCKIYTFNFPEPSTWREVLFAPRMIVPKDGTVTERIQRWLIDKGSFYSRAGKTLHQYVSDNRYIKPKFTSEEARGLYKYLDSAMLVESIAGHCWYLATTSMVLRSLELFFQSVKIFFNLAAMEWKTKVIGNLCIYSAFFGVFYFLGYHYNDIITFTLLPIFLENILSFKWANYFKQIHMLSSTKNFVLKNFLFNNMQAAFLRMLPIIYLFLREPELMYNKKYPGFIRECEISPVEDLVDYFNRGEPTVADLLLEPIMPMVGKMIFDLVYIALLKTISRDADLRDPMGWMFSWFRHKATASVSSEVSLDNDRKGKKPGFKRRVETQFSEEFSSDSFISNFNECNNKINCSKEHGIKKKIKTRGIAYNEPKSKSVKEESSKARELHTEINIEVGGCIRTFQKIADSNFNKETWGVIVADSVEKSKLKRYETGLSNGCLGGTIRQLTGHKGRCYEIGASIAARLLGKRYEDGVYQALQNFMRLEEALQFSQELERNGVSDDVSLIVFSVEAPNHDCIHAVAGKL